MRPAATAHRATTRAAALLWLVTLFLTAGALVVDRTRVVDAVTFLAFPTVGAFVAARRPNNPVGWILCVLGLPWGIERFGANYATYALVTAPGALPAPEMLAWLASWQWIVIAGLVQALLLFFPNGRLPSRRWRWAAWTSAASASLIAFNLLFTSGPLQDFQPEVRNPFGVLPAQLDAARTLGLPLFFAGFAASAATMLVRMITARGAQRAQLKWLSYAAVLFVFTFAVQGILERQLGRASRWRTRRSKLWALLRSRRFPRASA